MRRGGLKMLHERSLVVFCLFVCFNFNLTFVPQLILQSGKADHVPVAQY